MIISIESSGLQIQIEDDKNITLPAAGMQAKHGSIFEVAEASDAWVSADYHFGKWLRKEGEEAGYSRRERRDSSAHRLDRRDACAWKRGSRSI